MHPRKYFNANFPYDDTLPGLWTKWIAEYFTHFIAFVKPTARTHAVNNLRSILLKTFADILSVPQRSEDMISLQCVVFARNARIDLRFHQPVRASLDVLLIESAHGYQIEGLTFESRECTIPFVFRLELRDYVGPDSQTVSA